ncbi:ABC transporter substrate-binding protein [Oceanobacillus picturae]|uniref:ABC transporter substrate-binding protein n=1 Tax=Oceanobacillus picturae TaxID=171693 RepID=A0A0U9H5E2_9BACI|nr:extracellular solute-binding protein [Oceanobacillus picturae]RIU94850.1 extracellular solute-binding protein [Oceanobacillus picturae]GAQ16937.1 ABC transporter substrate-binding protein [Oceanobacillus picturae]
MKLRNFIVFGLIVLLLLGACKNDSEDTASEAEENLENLNKEGFPIVDDPITINFMTRKPPTTENDYNEVLVWEKYEEMTNVKIDWGLVPTEGFEEKSNLALAGGDYPEAFYTAKFSDVDIMKYGEQGVFLELNDLIDEHMPNVKKLFEQYPEIEKALTNADGKIYSLPTVYSPDFMSMTSNIKPWIREDWLKKLNMEMPETTEEYYQYLKAVKEGDPNGNGEADEIPYGNTNVDGMIGWLKGAYNIGNKGRKHAFTDLDPETNELRFYRTADGYKEMLEYINKLYSEGLINESVFTLETNEYHEQGSQGLYGSTVTTSPETRFGTDDFVGMPQLEGPDGHKDWVYITAPVVHKAAFVMTDKNKNPAATARWIDYFYGSEGAKMFFMGVEGETYEVTDDGESEYAEHITNDPDGLTFEQALRPYITWLGGGYPALVQSENFKGAENSPEAIEATKRLEPDMIDEVWPSFPYTVEENQRLSALKADIEKYVIEMQDKFIAGEESFDGWDKYVETLESMGLDEYMEIQQAAYERYLEN